MRKKYDAVIIGVGQAGKPLAADLANAGWKIAVVEKEHVGGSCVNYGCTPTKTMIASAKVAHMVRRSSDFGVERNDVSVDYKKVIKRRNEIFLPSRNSIEDSLKENSNIDFYKGGAYFKNDKEIAIEGENSTFLADKIFINTGTTPQVPDIKGMDTVPFMTAKTIMDLKVLPEHLIILGGGYIGLEYAQMMRRFGSKVTLVQKDKHLVSREDEDIQEAIEKILKDEGIKIFTSAKVKEVLTQDNKINLKLDGQTIKGTHLFIATGTVPNTKFLKLENAGVTTDEEGYIQVNKNLQTNKSHIYALGDVKGGPEFTHISYDDYRIVKNHLMGDKSRSVDDRIIPYTLFIDPELGRTGLTEKEAKEKNYDYSVGKMETSSAARARESGETKGFYKVLINNKDDTILGAAILAPQGGEIAGMLQIAMMGNLKWQQLRDGVFSHPTYAESLNNLFMKIEK